MCNSWQPADFALLSMVTTKMNMNTSYKSSACYIFFAL